MKRIFARILSLAVVMTVLSAAHLYAQNNDGYFTVVLFGDPEISMTDREGNNATKANVTKWVNTIINMNKECTMFKFSKAPEGFVPKADLVICMGDMDKDSQVGRGEIEDVFDLVYKAGIPFITMIGNHDVVPDYWNGGDKGVTWGSAGGSAANDHAFDMVRWYRNYAANNNLISDLKVFKDPKGGKQAEPFTFMFRGVRFYIGQTYWFQKTYDAPSLFGTATYYAPNGIISDLTTFVEQNASTPSVWVQHYPINAADRWWDDTNANGAVIAPKNTPDYATANAKRDKYKELIAKTTNPYHFSGHQHSAYTVNYTTGGKTFTDYTAPYFATKGAAYIALCKEGVGVIEVKQAIFDVDDPENQVDATPVTDFAQLSNKKCYTIFCSRGNLYCDGNDNHVRASGTITYNPTDAHQRWAIIKDGTKRYLYNLATEKYVTKSGTELVLVDQPDANSAVTFTLKKNKEGYPWTLKFGSNFVNVSSGFTYGLAADNWSTLDDGNQFAIYEVGDFGDPDPDPIESLISTHDTRYTSAVKLTTADGTQTIGDVQTAVKQQIYWDRTSETFTCTAGETLTAAVDYHGVWMNAYVYIDENKNGFEASDADIANHRLKTGTAIDLRSYSFYRESSETTGYNSLGEQPANGNTWTMPSFTAPTKTGTYTMRYKVDWNCIDPIGNRAENNHISANGGIIVDVKLSVQKANDIVEASADENQKATYSISGTRVANDKPLPRGMYIHNGRKRIVY